MKIAFIGQKGLPAHSGGVEKHVEDLAVSLAERGHEVMAYTRHNYTPKALADYKGISLIGLPSLATKNLDAISHTFLAVLDLWRREVDIIHFHGIGPSSLAWLARLIKPRAKIISTFHCQDYFHKKWSLPARTYLKFGEYVACRLTDMTIAVSQSLAGYVRHRYNRTAMYIPNGVHEAALTAPDLIKRWGLERGNYILSVSRLIRHKGLHHLISAFKKMDTDKKLVITGDGAFTDEYVSELKESAKGDARIIFTGQQTGPVLSELFTNAYLFAQPSHSEGLSIALLEAMSFSIAPLVSDIPENLEAIGQAGYSFISENESDLQAALEALLKDEAGVRETGAQAKARVAREYNWTLISDRTEAAYEQVMSQALAKKHSRSLLLSRLSMLL